MLRLRNEVEMMRELALVAVRESEYFHYSGDIYSLPSENGSVNYRLGFLDIRFVGKSETDSIVAFCLPNETIPSFYCLLSELHEG
ncbi:hypothetical protein ACFGZ1_05780 [Pasteurella multocida]